MKYQSTILCLLLIGVDQLAKFMTLNKWRHEIDFIIFKWKFVQNSGITLGWFGFLSPNILLLLQLIALGCVFKIKLNNTIKTFIIAGGMSNILDRFIHSAVIDYIQPKFLMFKWPAVINLADLYITMALLLWLIYEYKESTSNSTRIKLQSE